MHGTRNTLPARTALDAAAPSRVATAIIALVAVFVAWIGWGFWSLYERGHPDPPNVKAVAYAPAVRAADQQVTALMDSQLPQLRAQLPWAEPLASSLVDFCESDERFSGSFGGSDSWSPVVCRRVAVAYVGFDGDLQQRLTELDQTVAALGWSTGPTQGLAAQFNAAHQPLPGVDPEAAAQAAAAQRFTVGADYRRSATGPGVTLSVEVGRLPGPPHAPDSKDDQPWLAGVGSDGKAGSPDVYLTWQPVLAPDFAKTGHQYVAAIDFHAFYHGDPASLMGAR
ncbi:hypothetical protein [Kitasatospora sp. LaBMicrA B282]|uniref:hypothetical protein n=1 Tax=Kitasatospora sp. LaBMicrA B282 TaxID=3420949 RepID=UPI003D0BFBFB